MDNRAGKTKQNFSGELAYFSYVPASLPPTPEMEIKGRLLTSLVRAKANLMVLETLYSRIFDEDLFIYMYVRKEALLSSQIEGTQATIEDVFSPENEKDNLDVREVSNYVAALDYAVNRLSSLPLSNRLIKETHAILLSSGRGSEKNPGEFRHSQNWIGPANSTLRNAQYIPPSVDDMEKAMNELEIFMNAEDDIDPLIKIGLIHYQFETIHPFLDGNGRVGRMLIPLFLLEKKEISSPVFYISYFLKERRSEYYDRMSEVRRTGDYEQWLLFFLEAISSCSLATMDSIERLEKLHKEDMEKVMSTKKHNSALSLFEYLLKHPIIDISGVSKNLCLSFNVVSKAVSTLENLGILKRKNTQKRNRIFVYESYLEILKNG